MKTTLVENILTGFHTETDARRAAAQLTDAKNGNVAEYYKRDSIDSHCVRLVVRQADDANAKALRYHKGAVGALESHLRHARNAEETTHELGRRKESDSWYEIGNSLDTAIHLHGEFVRSLGGDV